MDNSEISSKPTRQGFPWAEEEEKQLYDAYVARSRIADIAETHMRSAGAIRSHLKKLGVLDENGTPIDPCPAFVTTAKASKKAMRALPSGRSSGNVGLNGTAVTPELNPRFGEALELMNETDKSIFITGKAGTGKSTLLRHFRGKSTKNIIVLAPTGIAALNVGGQTIHHFFRFQVDVTPQKVEARKKPRNAKLYKKIDTIVIDEISMVRADILDCVEVFLRFHGPFPGRPFGGVQMIFIGDLYQLPPVVGAQEKSIFNDHYKTPYFFSAHALKDFALPVMSLEKVYRQKDPAFIELLNRVRNDTVTTQDMAHLNSRYDGSAHDPDAAFSISLTATNKRADEINHEHLSALKGKTHYASADVKGDFGREYFPATPELAFKERAQVMMLTNDREGRWVNGSIGIISGVKNDLDGREYVKIDLQDHDEPIAVYPHKWEVYQFALSNDQIESEAVGTFEQYPFRLAWAVTIHKSQGKTFEKVTIDIGTGAFAGGQVYVALSRCTSFEGISLKTPLKRHHIHADPRIRTYLSADENLPDHSNEKAKVIELAIREDARLDITYLKGDGVETQRVVKPRSIGEETYKEKKFLGMKAYCLQSREELLFSVARILDIKRRA